MFGSKFFSFHGNNGVMSTNGPGKIRTSFSPHHTNCSRNEPLTGSSAIFINGFSSMWQSFTTYLGTPFLRAWLSPALLLPTGFHASLSIEYTQGPRENGGPDRYRTDHTNVASIHRLYGTCRPKMDVLYPERFSSSMYVL